MSYSLIWQPNSESTYYEEIDFIFLKWNSQEVQKFQDLVEENLERLCLNPKIGIYRNDLKMYSIVVSMQTTLYYSFNVVSEVIELHLFWNNSKSLTDLTKLL